MHNYSKCFEEMENTMKTQTLVKISGIFLLAASRADHLTVYALQNPQVMVMLATVSWNGRYIHQFLSFLGFSPERLSYKHGDSI